MCNVVIRDKGLYGQFQLLSHGFSCGLLNARPLFADVPLPSVMPLLRFPPALPPSPLAPFSLPHPLFPPL